MQGGNPFGGQGFGGNPYMGFDDDEKIIIGGGKQISLESKSFV